MDNAATSGEEIGTAMQRSAALADAAGVSFEMLGAYIATVSERTRQDAGTIGTALNAIMSRLTSVKAKGYNEEDETKVNDVAKALASVNIQLTDGQGQWRRIEDIFADVAKVWDTLDSKTQNYLATIMAGTRQQNVFRTLMADLSNMADGTSRAMELYEGALEAAGTAEQKYATYTDSVTAAHDRMSASWERVYSLFNAGVMKNVYNVGSGIGDALYMLFGGEIVDNHSYGQTISYLDSYTVGISNLIAKLEDYRNTINTAGVNTQAYIDATAGIADTMEQLAQKYPELSSLVSGLSADYGDVGVAINKVNEYLKEQYKIIAQYRNFDAMDNLDDLLDQYSNQSGKVRSETAYGDVLRRAFTNENLLNKARESANPEAFLRDYFESLSGAVTTFYYSLLNGGLGTGSVEVKDGVLPDALRQALIGDDGTYNQEAYDYFTSFFRGLEDDYTQGLIRFVTSSSSVTQSEFKVLRKNIGDTIVGMGENMLGMAGIELPDELSSSFASMIRTSLEALPEEIWDNEDEFKLAVTNMIDTLVGFMSQRLPELQDFRNQISDILNNPIEGETPEQVRERLKPITDEYYEALQQIFTPDELPWKSSSEFLDSFFEVSEDLAQTADEVTAFWDRMAKGAAKYAIEQEKANNWASFTTPLGEALTSAAGGNTKDLEDFLWLYQNGNWNEDEIASIEGYLDWLPTLFEMFSSGEVTVENASEALAFFNARIAELKDKGSDAKSFWDRMNEGSEKFAISQAKSDNFKGVTDSLSLLLQTAQSGVSGPLQAFVQGYADMTLYSEEWESSLEGTLTWLPVFFNYFKDGDYSIENVNAAMAFFNQMLDEMNGKKVEDPLKAIKDAAKGAWSSAQGDAIREGWRAGGSTGLAGFYDTTAGTVNWDGLLAQLQDYTGKGLSFEDMGLNPDAMKAAIDRYAEAIALDEDDPLRAQEIAAATEMIIAALNDTSDAWDRYHESITSEFDSARQAEILRDLGDSSSLDEMRTKFAQLTDEEQQWVAKSSRGFREVIKGTKSVEEGVEDLRREAASIEFKEMEDAGKIWDGMGDLIENAGKKNKDFSKTYGQMLDRVGDMAIAYDALAYIQSGATDNADLLKSAYSDLAGITGVDADVLRNDLSPALWALQEESVIASNTIAELFGWLASTAGVTFDSGNWVSQLDALTQSSDASISSVATLVQQMLKVAGASITMKDGVVKVNWPNGTPSGYAGRSASSKSKSRGGGGGGSKNSDSSNEKTISEIQKMTDMMKQIQDLFDFHQSMLKQIQGIFENKGELTNLIQAYQEEYDAIEKNNEVLRQNVKQLEALLPHQQELVSNMSTTAEGYQEASEDLDRLQKAHQEYTKQLLENVEAMDTLQKEIKEQKRAIRELEIDVENTILQAIEDREARIQEMLEGRIDAEEMVMKTIISLYERERDAIVKTAEARKTALEQELDLLDETLEKRKEAADQQDKQQKLAELEAKLTRISADPTRRKEQLELQEQIAELRDEIAWDTAEAEVDAQKASIDQQITSLEEYVEYVKDYYQDMFDHPKKLIAEMEEVLMGTDEEIIAFLKENDEEYAESTAAVQTNMVNGWQQTLDQMRGIIRLHWDEVHAIIAQGDEAIINFLIENSDDYRRASKLQAEAYLDEWLDKLDELKKAYKDTYEEIKDYSYVPIRVDESKNNKNSTDKSGGSGGGGGAINIEDSNQTYSGILAYYSNGNLKSKRYSVTASSSQEAHKLFMMEGNALGAYYARGSTYAAGGLAYATGPAWLDGSPNAPERVLSPYQTQLFEDMIATLHSIRVAAPNVGYAAPGMADAAGGVVLEGDIVVNVATLDSDADYEEVANRVMDTITDGIMRTSVVGGLRRTK